MNFTVVFLHAHPDDEALYTGGTMARLAAEGHRVVLVTATFGDAGLTATDAASPGLGKLRMQELSAAASALGCTRLIPLGYRDSGMNGSAPGAFSKLDPGEPAARVAAILEQERADAIVTYDANGGYGHPDHRQVHKVGAIAATMAGTALEFQATVDRDALRRALALATRAGLAPREFRAQPFDRLYTARKDITHRVHVGRYLSQKRAAMKAHRSQATGGETERTLALLLSLPSPVFRIVAGREWFVEVGRNPGRRRLDDLLVSLRLPPISPRQTSMSLRQAQADRITVQPDAP